MLAIMATSINCDVITVIDRQSSGTIGMIGSADAILLPDVTGQFAKDDHVCVKSNVRQILLHGGDRPAWVEQFLWDRMVNFFDRRGAAREVFECPCQEISF